MSIFVQILLPLLAKRQRAHPEQFFVRRQSRHNQFAIGTVLTLRSSKKRWQGGFGGAALSKGSIVRQISEQLVGKQIGRIKNGSSQRLTDIGNSGKQTGGITELPIPGSRFRQHESHASPMSNRLLL